MQTDRTAENFETQLVTNRPLAPFTTLGIGGPAKHFAEVTTREQLLAGVAWARDRQMPLFVLGGGSNIVVADEGFPGLVLHLSLRGISHQPVADHVMLQVGAGEEWDPLVAHCVAQNWAGVECLSGIPGRVGATPIQNVGAYGQETSETLVSVEALDHRTGELVTIKTEECEFGYRASRFKSRDRGRFVIISVTYRLTVNGLPAIRYAELQRYLNEHSNGSTPSLAEVREAVLTLRRRKAMVTDPNEPDSRSVGSFFVNPVVTEKEAEQVKARARRLARRGADMPTFAAGVGSVKLSAAWLIEQAGFPRGSVYGNVGTSSKHALAIINRGGGTAREVVALAEQIKTRVLETFGVSLTPEPVLVGFSEEKNGAGSG